VHQRGISMAVDKTLNRRYQGEEEDEEDEDGDGDEEATKKDQQPTAKSPKAHDETHPNTDTAPRADKDEKKGEQKHASAAPSVASAVVLLWEREADIADNVLFSFSFVFRCTCLA
jgi:hypothetical protein